ncbi:CBS domain-containing protein [Vibrio sp. HI00D65]|uniref:CBS domain-containing protein n=1 Tax=Vibrio sp. HI00D65 TaxID=1822216 RepID=UPI000A783130|nr:CBS domain-containing protein [Vibrio sp. HI00D65]
MKAIDIATFHPVTIAPEVSIQSAYELMEVKKVNALLVIEDTRLVGFLKNSE